jgi:hypothetical protein
MLKTIIIVTLLILLIRKYLVGSGKESVEITTQRQTIENQKMTIGTQQDTIENYKTVVSKLSNVPLTRDQKFSLANDPDFVLAIMDSEDGAPVLQTQKFQTIGDRMRLIEKMEARGFFIQKLGIKF